MKIVEDVRSIQTVAVRAAVTPVIESLELRRLLSSAPLAIVSGGILTMTGNSKDNHIVVQGVGGALEVTVDGKSQIVSAGGLRGINVNGVGGNDAITLQTNIPATLIGGSGDDSIIGGGWADSIEGDAGTDSLNGGGGNDTIYGNSGDDHLDGGTGVNQLIGGDGADIADYSAHASITIDASVHVISNSDPVAPGPVTVNKGDGVAIDVFDTEPQFHIIGTPGNDKIDLLFNGNATVEGGAGDDTLNGECTQHNIGTVNLNGDDGNDRFYIHEGDGGKACYGGRGDDTLTSTDGRGFADAGPGFDTQDNSPSSAPGIYLNFTASPGVEKLIVPGGVSGLTVNGNELDNQIVLTNDAEATVHGNGGNDLIQLSGQYAQLEGRNVIYGDDGDDTIQGDDGANGGDYIFGGVGDDSLLGGAANDRLDGGDGDDHFDGGFGTNSIIGGAGNNVFDYSAESDPDSGLDFSGQGAQQIEVKRTSKAGTGDDVTDGSTTTFASIIATPGDDDITYYWDGPNPKFQIFLGKGNDTIGVRPESEAALIDCGDGNDQVFFSYDSLVNTILGGNGDDIFHDNSGYDGAYTIDGGAGFDNDIVNPDEPVTGMATAEFTVPAGVEAYSVGAEHNLIVHGNNLDNIIDVNAANVTVYGMGGDDQITAKAYNYSPDYTAIGHVLIDGGDGNDKLHGIATLDSTLIGDAGNDSLTGDGDFGIDGAVPATPNFLMQGGDGNDHLFGGTGSDTLQGGAGNDVIYANDGNKDAIDGGDGFDNAKWDKDVDVLSSIDGRL